MAASSDYRIALVIPRSGPAGLYGPSCKRCAELATIELNSAGGLGGASASLVLVDGGQKPLAVADAMAVLLDANAISAVIGMHDSDVRQAVLETIGGRVPYVYAANYEGQMASEGVISIGLTAAQQLRGSVAWLAANRSVRRWFFIGNDYVWPRSSAETLQAALQENNLDLLGSEYVPLGQESYTPILHAIEQTQPDAVFAALVGADAIAFSRQFVRRGLDRPMVRFMPLFEENSLLAVGSQIGRGAFTAGTFFADSDGAAEKLFQSRYEAQFGIEAPQLNGMGVACYEAVKLLAVIAEAKALAKEESQGLENLPFQSVLGTSKLHEGNAVRDVLLAEAVDGKFSIRARFTDVMPDGRYGSTQEP